jgi:hypothetical protein
LQRTLLARNRARGGYTAHFSIYYVRSHTFEETDAMIDVNHEELMNLRQATRHPIFRNAEGKPGHVAAVYRAVNPGARAVDGQRIRLEVAKTPRGLVTSKEALQRFVDRLTDPDGDVRYDTATTSSRRRQQSQTDRALDAAGIA